MGKATGFMEFSRKNCSREDALNRINHWNEFDTPLTEEERKNQGAETFFETFCCRITIKTYPSDHNAITASFRLK